MRRVFQPGLRMLSLGVLTGLALSTPTMVVSAVGALPHFEILVAQELGNDREVSAFYSKRGFRPVWTGRTASDRQRIRALFDALRTAADHGLPYGQLQIDELRYQYMQATDYRSLATIEARFTELYLEFASALASGAINPRSVAEGIARKRPTPAAEVLLGGILAADPAEFLNGLAPKTANYIGLRKELRRLDRIIDEGGWGSQVEAAELAPQNRGESVVQLRNRLIRMGYLNNSFSARYNDALVFAVRRFQLDHGLDPDGEAGPLTVRAVNVEPPERKRQVLAALERARWMNFALGEVHVLVNLPEYQASLMDRGKSVFDTRVVVGKRRDELQTPEFSDEMTHLVLNPTWYVPRSIATEEVLPKLKDDPLAEPQLEIFHPEEGIIDRLAVNFARFDNLSFPFEMRQPPGPANALGRVKFMFPNRFNVYMHDTPLRALFQREARSFSHGCIRVHRAYDLAHVLLGRQYANPEEIFEILLSTGEEITINFNEPLPVHITYQTVWITPDGQVHYRDDIYGRDALIFGKLVEAGLHAGFPVN